MISGLFYLFSFTQLKKLHSFGEITSEILFEHFKVETFSLKKKKITSSAICCFLFYFLSLVPIPAVPFH